MKTVSGTFIAVEDVMEELLKIHQRLESLVSKQGDSSGEVVWASQATLAKRYDMSKSNMCRLLAGGIAAKRIRIRRPNGGVYKYNVEEVDSYILSVS